MATLLGGLAASALVVGAVIAYVATVPDRVTAMVMALGSGLLIGSVAYDLVSEAQHSLSLAAVAFWLVVGAAAFVGGSRIIDWWGSRGKGSGEAQQPMAILFGSALDGIPESFVLGVSAISGAAPWSLVIGVGLSNLPEGLAASAGMRKERWPLLRVLGLWAVVVVVSAACAGLGAVVLDDDQGTVAGIARTFAAGALLAMVSDTMVPDAYEKVREWAGGLVVLGFALSLLLAGLLS